MQVIDLCKQADDGYKAVALTCAETELQFVSDVSVEIDLCAKKALAFVQKMLKLITDGTVITFTQEEMKAPSGLRWTGQNLCPERGREEAGCRRVLASLYWEGPSELPHRRSSSSAPRRDSTEPRPRGCSVLGEPPQALPSF